MMQTMQKQRGITAISALLLLIIGGFFILLLMKLGPIYLENYKVKTVLASVESEPGLGAQPPSQIRKTISKKLYINEVRRLEDKAIKMKRVDDVVRVNIDYEVRENIMANVDALVTFNEQVELKAR